MNCVDHHQGWQYAWSKCCSIKQYIVSSLDVNYILPDECSKISPLDTIQRVLWSVKNDSSSFLMLNPPMEPSWMCYNDPPCHSSTYFKGELFYKSDPVDKDIMDRVEANFCSDIINALMHTTSKEEAAEVMSMFDVLDPFFSGYQGRFYTSPVAIKESTHPQPHLITMSVSIDKQTKMVSSFPKSCSYKTYIYMALLEGCLLIGPVMKCINYC